MAKNMVLAMETKVVNALPPNSGATGVLSDFWRARDAAAWNISLWIGANNDTGDLVLTINKSTSLSTQGSKIGFSYQAELTAAGDTLSTQIRVLSTGTGITLPTAGTANIMFHCYVPTDELDEPNLYCKLSGSTGVVVKSISAHGTGLRWKQEQSRTAVA